MAQLVAWQQQLSLAQQRMHELIHDEYPALVRLCSELHHAFIPEESQPSLLIASQPKSPFFPLQETLDRLEQDYLKPVRNHLNAVQDALEERRLLRKKKECLHIFLHVHQALQKLTQLLDRQQQNKNGGLDWMKRAATQWNQLSILIKRSSSLSNNTTPPFIANLSHQLDQIRFSLKQEVDGAMKAALTANPIKQSELVKVWQLYQTLDWMSDADDVVFHEYVRPVLQGKCPLNFEMLQQVVAPIIQQVSTWFPESTNRLVLRIFSGILVKDAQIFGLDKRPSAATEAQLFHNNFIAATKVVQYFESALLNNSGDVLGAFRQSDVYQAFWKTWSCGVYAQVKILALMQQAESACASAELDANGRSKASLGMLEVLETIWSDNVVLWRVRARFWRFSVQVMMRYETWVNGLLQNIDLEKCPKMDISTLEQETKQWAMLFIDIATLANTDLVRIYRNGLGNDDFHLVEPSVVKAKENILSKAMTIIPYLTTLISLQCIEGVKLIRNVPAMYRRMNKEDPKTPSYFVPSILQPLKNFVKDYSVAQFESGFITTILARVTIEYKTKTSDLLTNLRDVEESLKRLQTKKQSSSLLGGSRSDEDKIRRQLYLDIQAYSNDVNEIVTNPTMKISTNEEVQTHMDELKSVVAEFSP